MIAIEDQRGLRIDCCEQCRCYLKTYQGQGSKMVLLADLDDRNVVWRQVINSGRFRKDALLE